MTRKHVLVIALVLALAAIAGLVAAAQTTGARASAHGSATTAKTAITLRSRTLDRLEASLRRSLAKKPPGLPTIPVTSTGTPPAKPVAPRITYVRAAPIVVHRHTGGEHEHEGGDMEGRHPDD